MSTENYTVPQKLRREAGGLFLIRMDETPVQTAFRWQQELDSEIKKRDVLIDRLLTALQPFVHPAVWRALHEDF